MLAEESTGIDKLPITQNQIKQIKDKKELEIILDKLSIVPPYKWKTKAGVKRTKNDLKKWLMEQCHHNNRTLMYDMSCCLCPECDTILTYNIDIDIAECSNCGYANYIELHGCFDDDCLDDFFDLEKDIRCYSCEYEGTPFGPAVEEAFKTAAQIQEQWR